jgi:large-conductance mechanosensitive channel
MISNSKKIILRIIGFILVVILILIVVQYVSLMIKNNENNSSQTVDTIEENNKLIHTEIKENDKQKFLEDAQENLILQITDKLKNKLEGFEDP